MGSANSSSHLNSIVTFHGSTCVPSFNAGSCRKRHMSAAHFSARLKIHVTSLIADQRRSRTGTRTLGRCFLFCPIFLEKRVPAVIVFQDLLQAESGFVQISPL